MSNGRYGRSNPYRSQFTSNPYLQSVFEGIDMLVADTQRHNLIAQRQAESNVEFERTKNIANLQRKFGLLFGIAESKGVVEPETKVESLKTMFGLIQDPNLDISDLDIKAFQKPAEPAEPTRKLTEYAVHPQFGFPKFKDKELPHDVADFMESESRMRRKAHYDRTKKTTTKEPPTPRRRALDEYRTEALKILHSGFKEGGYAGTVGLTPEITSQFLGIIEDLRRKDDTGKWTEKEEAIFKTLRGLEVSGIGGQDKLESLHGVILEAADRLRKMRE